MNDKRGFGMIPDPVANDDPKVTRNYIKMLQESCADLLAERDEARRVARWLHARLGEVSHDNINMAALIDEYREQNAALRAELAAYREREPSELDKRVIAALRDGSDN